MLNRDDRTFFLAVYEEKSKNWVEFFYPTRAQRDLRQHEAEDMGKMCRVWAGREVRDGQGA